MYCPPIANTVEAIKKDDNTTSGLPESSMNIIIIKSKNRIVLKSKVLCIFFMVNTPNFTTLLINFMI